MKLLFVRPPRYMWPMNSESSSFWQPIGFASMAAIIDPAIPVGLDTLGWFKKDIVEKPIKIKNGQIDLNEYNQLLSARRHLWKLRRKYKRLRHAK